MVVCCTATPPKGQGINNKLGRSCQVKDGAAATTWPRLKSLGAITMTEMLFIITRLVHELWLKEMPPWVKISP